MSEVDKTLRRIKAVRTYCDKTIKESKDSNEIEDAKDLQEFVLSLIEAMAKYTASVFDDEIKNVTRKKMIEESNSVREYQEKCEQIERTRKSCHDNLIIQIKVTDILCRLVGVEEIYGKLPEEYRKDTAGLMGDKNRRNPGVVETRHAIADWTWDVVLGSTVAMTLDIDEMDYNKDLDDREKIAEEFKRLGGVASAKRAIKEMTEPEI